MNAKNYFLSSLSVLLLSVVTQNASAHLVFHYQTAEMNWLNETSNIQGESTISGSDYLMFQTFQFDVTFITPDLDFDLDELEIITMEFDNPVVSVSSTGFFQPTSIERSNFKFDAYNIEGIIYTDWMLTFDIIDDSLPNNTALSASVTSRGFWDYMTLHVDTFHYRRKDFEVILDIDAEFEGEYSGEYSTEYPHFGRLSVSEVSVPEPLSPLLILSGLVAVFSIRKMKAKDFS